MNTAKRSPLPTDIDVKDHALAISQILIVFRKQFLKFNLRKSQHKFWTKKKVLSKIEHFRPQQSQKSHPAPFYRLLKSNYKQIFKNTSVFNT